MLRKDYGVRVVKALGQIFNPAPVRGLSVTGACQYKGMSRQAYYQDRSCDTQRAERARVAVRLVQCERMRQPRVGTRKLHHTLREPPWC